MPPRRVTLTADFGAAYAAQIAALFAREAPHVVLTTLSVELVPHGIPEAAFLLDHMASGFPRGTVHLAVVDPGVGGRRAAIAVRTRTGHFLVGPDNGLLDELAVRLGVADAVRLKARASRVGATFDGRDLFAPAALHLAGGATLRSLGPRFAYHPAPPAPPVRQLESARGTVRHVDRFGNLVTDVPSPWAAGRRGASVRVGRRRAVCLPVVRIYEDLRRREAGLIPSSFGTLEVARREAPFLPAGRSPVGEGVTLRWWRPGHRRGHRN